MRSMRLALKSQTDQIVWNVDFFLIGAHIMYEETARLEIYIEHVIEVRVK